MRVTACWGLLYVLGYLAIRVNCSNDSPLPNTVRLPNVLCVHSLPERALVYNYMPMFRLERALTGKSFTRAKPWAFDAELASSSWVPPWSRLFRRSGPYIGF
jgi:hypothetical protein